MSDEEITKTKNSNSVMVHLGLFLAGAVLSKYMWLMVLTGAQFVVSKYIAPTTASAILIEPVDKASEQKLIKTVDNKLYILDMDSTEWFKVIAGALTLYETYRKIRTPTKKESDNA